jgi:hypothetical protein
MTLAERNYRRVLRLLPANYRQFWEEDMVSAYLDSVGDSRRRSGTSMDAAGALDDARDLVGATDDRWVNAGIAGEEYIDYLRARS